MSGKYWFLLALLAMPATAFAYVDPGTGMLLWQGLIAVVGALLMFVREPIKTLKRWFRRNKR